jgi:hypothetical protein
MSDKPRRIVIEQADDGRVGIRIENLPADKVTLYGLLEVARDAIPKIVEQAGGRIQLPAGVKA